MERIYKSFVDHPSSVGESYLEHLVQALGFGLRMIAAGCACIVHAFLPFLFVNTASRQVTLLYSRMVTNRSKRCERFDFVI